MTEGPKDTALSLARTRFVEGLAKKSDELGAAVALVIQTPGVGRPREELRRRLHTLYASAQVFHLDTLAKTLKDALDRLDRAADESRTLNASDLYELNALPAQIAQFGPPRQPSMAPAARVQRLVQTLTGMPSVRPATASATAPGSDPSAPTRPQTPPQPPPEPIAPALAPEAAAVLPSGPLNSLLPTTSSSVTIAAPALTAMLAIPAVPSIAPAPRAPSPSLSPPTPAPSVTPADGQSMPPPARQSIAAIQPVKRAFRARRPSGSFTARRPEPSDGGSIAPSARNQPQEARVISVLVMDSADVQAEIRGFLSADRFEVLGARDPEEALRLARSSAPDVVLADSEIALRESVDFIARLRNDPLTDFVPVVLLLAANSQLDSQAMHDAGADDAISKPLQANTVTRVLSRATSAGESKDPFFVEIGDATVSEIVDRLSAEIRRGLTESVQAGKDIKIPVGEGSELLAAAWSAIARTRAELAMRSNGRVRFRDVPRRGGASVLALVDDDDESTPLADVSIEGKRILVIDDDPSIVWFFAGLLREAGAEVIEAADGRSGLEKMRARRVELVITDILMPEIDGFALCREMRRDPALTDIPVILLSWKEDLLQRMRDLQSGANGYLRKEAGSAKILARVKQLLRPQVRLDAELRAGGEVRGSLDRVGVITLLRTVSRVRPNARITLRDAWNLFEIDVREGKLVDLTRTATDGSFSRGSPCVPQLLGATSGRFTVVESNATIRSSLDRPLEALLDEGVATLGALMDSVSSTGLSRAAHITFDDDILSTLLQASPPPIAALVDRLKHGAGPRDLLLEGEVAPQTLEGVLIDLARRGAVRSVRGVDGEDCVAESLHARKAYPGTLFGSEPPPSRRSKIPSAPNLVITAPSLASLAEAVRNPSLAPAPSPSPSPSPSQNPAPMKTDSQVKRDLDELFPDVQPRSSAPPVAVNAAAVAPLMSPPPEPRKRNNEATEVVPTVPPPKRDSSVQSRAPSESSLTVTDRPPAPKHSRPPVEVDGGISGWVWVLLVIALGALGFFGYRAIQTKTAPTPSRHSQVSSAPTAPAAVRPAPSLPAAPVPAGAETPTDEPLLQPLGDDPRFGRTEPTLVDTHVEVGPEQGLLVVQAPTHGEHATVIVDSHEIGAAPLTIAISEGSHDVEIRHDDVSTFAYIVIQRGTSRIVSVP
ncbi:MAG: response regulator [Sandaracinaceae bacterium]|nr:response regulator [Sandaracinaceae bacterium]